MLNSHCESTKQKDLYKTEYFNSTSLVQWRTFGKLDVDLEVKGLSEMCWKYYAEVKCDQYSAMLSKGGGGG